MTTHVKQPLLCLRKAHPLDAYYHPVEDFERDDPNYDGQGKSQQQETDDSLRMLGVCFVVMLVAVVVGIWLVFQ